MLKEATVRKGVVTSALLALALCHHALAGATDPGVKAFEAKLVRARPLRSEGRPGRMARSWFSFEMPVDPARPAKLVVTYYSAERRRDPAHFEIQVNGRRIGQEQLQNSEPARFFDVEYAIPADLIGGKEKVTVRFQAAEGGVTAGVYGIRTIRADAQ